jgi:DNA-damage-inducible protein J
VRHQPQKEEELTRKRIAGRSFLHLGLVVQMNYNHPRGCRMPANALVQTRIDPEVKKRASAVLGELGITVSDAVRILLTRTANEGALPFSLARNAAEHDAWFRARVREALDDPRPPVPHNKVKAHFARRRAAARQKGKR